MNTVLPELDYPETIIDQGYNTNMEHINITIK